MNKRQKGKLFAGIILILLGLSLAGINIFTGLGHNTIQLLLGGLFIAWYFYSNSYGLLIPGCILAGLGLASLGSRHFLYTPHNSQFGLGLGFIAIYVIDRLYSGKTHWWPLLCGALIALAALARGAYGFKEIYRVGWPFILILIGLYIIIKSLGITNNKNKQQNIHPLNKTDHE